MAISCAHCGGAHQRPDEVRACWASGADHQQREQADAPQGSQSTKRAGSHIEPGESQGSVRVVGADIAPQSLHPPRELGRQLVISSDHSDQIPEAWSTAERVRINDDVLRDHAQLVECIRRGREARARSESIVWELAPGTHWDPDQPPGTRETDAPEVLGAQFTLDLDDFHYLIWSHCVDLRDPDRPRWPVIDLALTLGARLPGPEESGDLVVPNVGSVWVDAGPVRWVNPLGAAQVSVLSSVSIAHGSLRPPVTRDCAADLAPDQLAAVCHDRGAVRVIAPAGSGKTRVLTERARHLINNWQVPTSAITVLAFNRRAQEELTERTQDLPGLQVRTLNSVALAIMNGTGPFARQSRPVTTINEPEVRRLLGDLINLPRRRNTDPLAPWIEALSAIRLGLRDPAIVEELYDGDVNGLRDVWPAYNAALQSRGWVDFDGQIYGAITLLLGDPVARKAAQKACQVLCVDEFQDLTPAHILLIRLLAGPEGSVFAVGDDDQTIYGYNGADPAWLIDFATLFPGSGAHPLEVNYRCPPDLVQVVDRLLRHNRRRVPKKIRAAPERNLNHQGWSTISTADPVADTTSRVAELMTSGCSPDEIAVLARVNAVLVPVQVALIQRQIPVTGGVGPEFLDRTAIRAFLAWLRLGYGRFNAGDLVEALRRPSRPLHPRCTTWVSEQKDLHGLRRLALRLRDERESQRVLDFATDIEGLGESLGDGASTADCVRLIIDEYGLGSSISTVDLSRKGMNRASQSDDLTALRQLSLLQSDPAQFESWLHTMVSMPSDAHGVMLSTVHRVKGQQWPQVIVHLADDEQFPHRLADDVDEERRLFHVALTRAETHATIVTGVKPSRFVTELTTEPDLMADEPTAVTTIRSSTVPKTKPNKTVDVASMAPVSQRAAELLRAYRNEAKGSRPAYLVFDDATLYAIAEDLPESLSELAAIRGIGPAKLELHGDAVLSAIQLALSEQIAPDHPAE
jgi:DNA helicase II / ATP-dependent DNA helicase PcrA